MDCMPISQIRTPGGWGIPPRVQALPVLSASTQLGKAWPGRCGLTNRKMVSKWEFWVRPHSQGLKAEGDSIVFWICGAP